MTDIPRSRWADLAEEILDEVLGTSPGPLVQKPDSSGPGRVQDGILATDDPRDRNQIKDM